MAPYLHIEVEDEDSLTTDLTSERGASAVDIAVIRLPRISNFTDFNPFEQFEACHSATSSSVEKLKNPDLILLPARKNTMEDLKWMRQNGLEASFRRRRETFIFGICGGYQMLGDTLSDPLHVEAGGTIKGMGLLPMDTVFAGKEKFCQRNAPGAGREKGDQCVGYDGMDFAAFKETQYDILADALRKHLDMEKI